MLGKKKSRHTAVTLVVLVLSIVLIIPEAALGFGMGPPAVYLDFTPKSWAVGDGCPATYTVRLISQEGFKGLVKLTAIGPPKGIDIAFNPNPIDIPEYSEAVSYLTVKVSPDVPYGIHTLYFNLTALPNSNYDRTYGFGVNGYLYFTINVGPCIQSISANTTTVTIEPAVITSTITSTSTITEQAADPSTYAWAVSATIVAAVLAVAVVLLLQRRRTKYSA